MVTRQHETTEVTEFVNRCCEEFLGVRGGDADTIDVLYLRLEQSWYRAFLDEAVLFLDESAGPDPEDADEYLDLAEDLGVRGARLRNFSFRDGVLRVAFDGGTTLVLAEQDGVTHRVQR